MTFISNRAFAFFALVPLIIWLYILLGRGLFWLLDEGSVAMEPLELARWPRIVAIIPARNEAETIAQTVVSLAMQDYPGEFRFVVVDDHSDDDTAQFALRAAMDSGSAASVTVHTAADLEPGWTGKLWALNQGIDLATHFSPDYFWFTDADITHAPDTLRSLVFRAEKESLSLYSRMVLLQAKAIPERLLIPSFLYFFLMLYPPRWTFSTRASTAGAAGGCVLIRRDALEKFGGLSVIRAAVIDDCTLAKAVKESGGRVKMNVSRKSISLRSYESFSEIRDMIARTAFTQLRYSTFLLVGTLLGMLLTYIAPIALLFSHDPVTRMFAVAAWLLMTVSFAPTVRFYKLSPLWSLLLPLAALFYSYATWLSAARYWLGRGGQWKGRAQAPKGI